MNKRKIANKIFLGFTDAQWETIDHEFSILEEDIKFLNSIDTDGVEAMDLPFTLNENHLRMDEAGETLSVEDVLLNAADKDDNMVRIVKVVK